MDAVLAASLRREKMDETNTGPVPGESGYTASSSKPTQVDETPLSALDAPWMNASLSPDERAALLLGQMTLAEKIAMVHGEYGPYGFYNTPLPRLGIPALTMADGPTGIHVSNAAVNEGKATAFPAPIALAATWDIATAEQYGDLIGNEAVATGHNVFLGPGMDIARVPVFGRLFEALGEDPRLTGQLAAAYIRGVQSHPIVACAKHYNMNTQEQQRMEIDAHVDERTLQEIYTLPFEIVVKEAQLGSAMGAFNKVNGLFACEQPHLLTDILKQQLGFTGWVMSDYGATQSTVEAANAGLDQEMPAATYFGDRLVEAIEAGQVSMATLEDKVRRILRTMFVLGLFEHPVGIRPFSIQEHGQWARTIASQGIVLLKNREALLPLSSDALSSVAIIGADANANIAGGGSSLVKPTYLVSMLEGIRRRAGAGIQVEYAEGVDPLSAADLLPGPPPVPSSVLTPAGSGSGVRGLHAEYWTNTRFAGEPSLVRTDRQVALNLGFFNYPGFNACLISTPLEFNNIMSVRWTGSITAPVTGDYTLSLTHLGTARLFLDGQRLIDDPGVTLSTQSASVHLVAGEAHALQIEYASDRPEQGASWIGSDSGSEANGGYGGGGGGGLVGAKVRLGWEHPEEAICPMIQEAAAFAARSDVAVVVVRDYSNEDADRPGLTLPNEQDLLVQAVAAANPRTIVALATGGAASMPWLDQVPAVLECWYGGQEMGSALASVLFGDVNPSGKLPVTFPRSEREMPLSSPEQYPGVNGVAHFSEGLAVGYRGYDQFEIEPLFPFGYGLSYTSFTYSELRVEPETSEGTSPIQVSFTLTNTGSRRGAEVAQVYLGLPDSTGEPPKRLVGWAKVELEPGESREVIVTLDPNAASCPLSSWNVDTNGWEIAHGDYVVYVGASSRDIRLTGTLRV
ncbi:MAG: beta-glucosidase [Chloroflexi bacterium]|nr:MAG: beta-glucosidase [Chloroflexota bacterium]